MKALTPGGAAAEAAQGRIAGALLALLVLTTSFTALQRRLRKAGLQEQTDTDKAEELLAAQVLPL
jgi:hypothetical protein